MPIKPEKTFKLKGWQSIKTAPTDGRFVFTYHPDLEKFKEGAGIVKNRVSQGHPPGVIVWQNWSNPTHWMPLPKPPKGK